MVGVMATLSSCSSSVVFSARRTRTYPSARALILSTPLADHQRYCRHRHDIEHAGVLLVPGRKSSTKSAPLVDDRHPDVRARARTRTVPGWHRLENIRGGRSVVLRSRPSSPATTILTGPRNFCSSSPRAFASSSRIGDSDTGDDRSDISPTQTTLALSVHFLHPDLGMKEYEILSRATAFLLATDPPTPNDDDDVAEGDTSATHSKDGRGRIQKAAFPHLLKNQKARDKLLEKQQYAHDPASGPRRFPHQLNWLEFCPATFRPSVHVIASSHVLSPWTWPKYYGQEWLASLTAEHVRYSLEVYGSPKKNKNETEESRHDGRLTGGACEPLAKFALNPYPIHHPNGMDLALIHLKQEETALKHLKDLGVRPLHLRTMHELESSTDPVFESGERVLFQGFEVAEANDDVDGDSDEEDTRLFHPYSSAGSLTYGSPDRFLASTEGGPLPEGLCGGPVIDFVRPLSTIPSMVRQTNGDPFYIRGVVEGIVPPDHENPSLAGSASFLPAHRVREFVDHAERFMLEEIIPKEIFERVVEMKEGKSDGARGAGSVHTLKAAGGGGDDDDGEEDPEIKRQLEIASDNEDTPHIDKHYEEIVASLRENHTPEEVEAILATIDSEREEIISIMEKEGGDMDEVVERVRQRTYEKRDKIFRDIQERMESAQRRGEDEVPDAEFLENGKEDGDDAGRLKRRRKRPPAVVESKDDGEKGVVPK